MKKLTTLALAAAMAVGGTTYLMNQTNAQTGFGPVNGPYRPASYGNYRDQTGAFSDDYSPNSDWFYTDRWYDDSNAFSTWYEDDYDYRRWW